MTNKRKFYEKPEASEFQMCPNVFIAVSYGDDGEAGNYNYLDDITYPGEF